AIEILSEKSPDQYRKVLERIDIDPAGFAMVGNSLRSDVVPVLDIGGHAVHVPYGIIWGHERVDDEPKGPCFHRLETISELPGLLAGLG
ncbi:MAG: HAD family hydrolase, partial [Actinomycetota bacterium]